MAKLSRVRYIKRHSEVTLCESGISTSASAGNATGANQWPASFSLSLFSTESFHLRMDEAEARQLVEHFTRYLADYGSK
jgi:hypothetical protein